jgi:hypothetical protein
MFTDNRQIAFAGAMHEMLNWGEVPGHIILAFSGDDALTLSTSVVVTPIIKSFMKHLIVVRCEI